VTEQSYSFSSVDKFTLLLFEVAIALSNGWKQNCQNGTTVNLDGRLLENEDPSLALRFCLALRAD
jgi:hypothetical protein